MLFHSQFGHLKQGLWVQSWGSLAPPTGRWSTRPTLRGAHFLLGPTWNSDRFCAVSS